MLETCEHARSTTSGCACRGRMATAPTSGAVRRRFMVIFERETERQAGYLIAKDGCKRSA